MWGLLRKSKPYRINLLAAALGGILVLGASAGAATDPPRLVVISRDTTLEAGAQHATTVEPDAVASGTRIVTAFQVGRNFGGGAVLTGFASSTDAGRTWQSGALTAISEGGSTPFTSDPVVAYDALHGRWLIATLSRFGGQSVIYIQGSSDGSAWESPAIAIGYPVNQNGGTSLDKEWITCDNGPTSPLRGRCYLAYTDIAHDVDREHPGSHIAVQSTTDGGRTWSAPVLLTVDADFVSPGVQPVVRPNGELVVVFFEDGVAEAVRSTDGGATFSERERISRLVFHQRPVQPTRLRAFSLPTATVDAAGRVYVAWHDCRFRAGCATDDIVWSRSAAPGRWTIPKRVPLGALRSPADFVLPDLAVDPASGGARARLALTYYRVSSADCTETNCLLDVFLVTSRTAGARWSRPRRLNPRAMRLTWLAQTVSGRMVGDYTGTVFAGKRVVSVHVQARAPQAGRFNEATYAFSLTLP